MTRDTLALTGKPDQMSPTRAAARPVLWIPEHVGSTGYVSPRETWPDDTDINEAIAEAETLREAMFEIAEKFEVPVSNNLPRWQEGRFVRHVGDFLEDIYVAFDRFMPIPISLANTTTVGAQFGEQHANGQVTGLHDEQQARYATTKRGYLGHRGVTRQVWSTRWEPLSEHTE